MIGETPEGDGCWKGVLEGIQSDQDFLRLMFSLRRGPNTQLCCHYCDSIQWVSTRSTIGPLNNAESLYTVFGPRESDCTMLGKEGTIWHVFFFKVVCPPTSMVFICYFCGWQGSYRGMNLSLFMVKHQSAKLPAFGHRETWLVNWKNGGCFFSQFSRLPHKMKIHRRPCQNTRINSCIIFYWRKCDFFGKYKIFRHIS